jgi:16S rRNA (guanine527-N7)-methyltransferase
VSDVSRETAALIERYGAVPGLSRFAEILSSTGVERGLIGPREVPRLWPRHLANCAVVAEEATEQLTPGAHVADVGAGAGLPGVVWSLVRPDLHVTLIEPLLRRSTFLSEVVAELGLGDRVVVQRARAEDVVGSFDVVTARAVARLDKLVPWALPLVRGGGWLVALKGAGAATEVSEAMDVIVGHGGGAVQIRAYGAGVLVSPTTVVLVQQVQPDSP